MTKTVSYDEPWPFPGEDGGNDYASVTITMSAADAIRWQRAYLLKVRGIEYKNDDEALMDFIVCHWATVSDT